MNKILFLLILTISISAYGEISFKNEDEKEIYNSFKDTEFSSRMVQIKGFLEDFRKLTEKYLKEKNGKKWEIVYSRGGVKGIKNTDWEMQIIGFTNIPRYISGAYLRKCYENALLKFKLAEYRFKNSEIDEKELETIRRDLEQAEKEIKTYITGFHYVD